MPFSSLLVTALLIVASTAAGLLPSAEGEADSERRPTTASPRSFRPRRPIRATARPRRVTVENLSECPLDSSAWGAGDGETKAAAGERRSRSARLFGGLAPFAVPSCSRRPLSRPPKFSALLTGDSIRSSAPAAWEADKKRAAEPSVRLAPGGRCCARPGLPRLLR